MNRSALPAWMPPVDTIRVVPAGRWWDAIVLPQALGLDALQVLDDGTQRCPGPVIWDTSPPKPRLYFLVPVGTADTWTGPGEAHGRTTFIGIPGPTTLEPPSPHWLCPPDPDDPERLVDPGALLAALAAFTTTETTA